MRYNIRETCNEKQTTSGLARIQQAKKCKKAKETRQLLYATKGRIGVAEVAQKVFIAVAPISISAD